MQSFTIGVILARLLGPKEFGLVAMVSVFTELTNLIIDSGFGSSVVQRQNITQHELSSIFFFNLTLGLISSILIFFSAPYIAQFYGNDLLTPITQWIAVTYFLRSTIGIHAALQQKKMNFKALSIIRICSSLIASLIAVVLAYQGYGVWALVYQSIAGVILLNIGFWGFTSWRPSLHFKISELKRFWSFGSKILLSRVISEISNKLDTLVVGKVFSSATLGLFNRGKSYAFLPVGLYTSTFNQTLYSAFSSIQDDRRKFKSLFQESLRFTLLTFIPLSAYIFFFSDHVLLLLLGKEWIGASSFLSIFIFCGTLYIINGITGLVFNSLGNPNVNLGALVILGPIKIMSIMAFWLYSPTYFTPEILAYIFLGTLILEFFYRQYFLKRELGKNISTRALRDILSISLSVFIVIYFVHFAMSLLKVSHHFYVLILSSLFSVASILFMYNIFFKQEINKLRTILVSQFL